MSRRTERIQEQLKEEVSRLLREDVTDPRIRLVTLTRVDVAPDLSNARIYWSALDADEERVELIQDGLESAAAFVRRRLSRVLPLRKTPALVFRHDPSLALGNETLSLLRELSHDEET